MSAIRVAKLFFDGVTLEASESSSLYKLLCPDAVTEKGLWEKILRAFCSPETAHLTLAWRYENGWEKAIQWPIFMEARKWSPDMVFETKEQNAVQLLTKLINTKGGEEIFAEYVEAIANAIATSKYTEVDEELQSKLRVSFWDDYARPTFDKLRANKAAQDQIKQEIAEKEATQANQAASNYLAARN